MDFNLNEENKRSVDMVRLFKAYWKNIIFIVLAAVVGAAVGFGYSHFIIKPTYKANTLMYVNNATSDKSSVSSSDLTASAKLVSTFGAIIKSNSVLQEAIDEMGVDMKPKSLANRVSVSAVDDTQVFKIIVSSTDKEFAAKAADAISNAAQKQIPDIIEGTSIRVVDYATVPTAKSSPNDSRNTVIGAVIGLLIILIIVTIREVSDTRIKDEEDFKQWNIPVLGTIPDLDSHESGSYGYGNYGYGYEQADKERRKK